MEFLLIIIGVIAIIAVAYRRKQINEYEQTSYYKVTHNAYDKVWRDKGLEGEYLIYRELMTYEADGAKLIFNCYIPKQNGQTTEIDMIMIHRSGIYVIESKNYSGWIFGNERDEKWTQSLLGKGHTAQKEHFFNPVLQNKIHIRHLCRLLNGYEQKIYSIIVFSDRCELKSITLNSPQIKVLRRYELKSSISEYMMKDLLSEEEITKAYDLLLPYTQLSEEQKQEHTKNVGNSIEAREAKKGKICPRCGAALVLRTVKKGDRAGNKFFGCSEYPKCRYTENIQH
ncbi:NERD domain-containing protein [uncultured Phascolarctobacterium sp.]|uniref:NERD domain-containing protein n=1 Tax=uncultured Phascolarctobacterium sp. TaxID=512296 RepID=UPI0025E5B29B|nr:NERD domain-containing protein [uncultured Phascolarctobacterium sp.]